MRSNDVTGAIVAIAILIFALILMAGFCVKEFDEVKQIARIGEAYLDGELGAKETINKLMKIDDGSGYKEIIISFVLEDISEEEAKEILQHVAR